MILVTGATGFLGRRVCLLLQSRGLKYVPTSLSLGLDLRERAATLAYFDKLKPAYVINCAAYVGGIQFGYKHSAELFHNNLHMTLNLLEAVHVSGVKRLVNPISNCAYPAAATLFRESEFWDGPLHESVLVYGFARKASWVGAWAYAHQYRIDILNLIFSNMYGPGDHFEEERSHALGALIMKFVQAREQGLPEVLVWGTGRPVREWLHVDDAAEALLRGLDAPTTLDPVNVGVGKGISIGDMANLVKELVGYQGNIVYDPERPDGAPYKTVDGSQGQKLLGWTPTRSFKDGVRATIDWYLEHRRMTAHA